MGHHHNSGSLAQRHRSSPQNAPNTLPGGLNTAKNPPFIDDDVPIKSSTYREFPIFFPCSYDFCLYIGNFHEFPIAIHCPRQSQGFSVDLSTCQIRLWIPAMRHQESQVRLDARRQADDVEDQASVAGHGIQGPSWPISGPVKSSEHGPNKDIQNDRTVIKLGSRTIVGRLGATHILLDRHLEPRYPGFDGLTRWVFYGRSEQWMY